MEPTLEPPTRLRLWMRFQERIKVLPKQKRDDNSSNIIVEVSATPEKLLIEVARKKPGQIGERKHNPVCRTDSRLSTGVVRCAGRTPARPRRRPGNGQNSSAIKVSRKSLRTLTLGFENMLVAFGTQQMRSCRACGKLMDKNYLTRSATRRRLDSDGVQISLPFHEECLY